MAKWIADLDSLNAKDAVPAIYVFAKESSVRYKTMRSRAYRLAVNCGRLPKEASFRDWNAICLRGKWHIKSELQQRTGLRDLVVHLVGRIASGDSNAFGICVVGNYEHAFGKCDQRAVVEFFHSYKIRLLDASCPERKFGVEAPQVERKLVPPTATYRTDKQKFGRLKAAITRALRGTTVGKKPVLIESDSHAELDRALRQLARLPRRVPSDTGKRQPRHRLSYGKMADGLNKLGILGPGGERWTRSVVHRYIEKHLPSLLGRRKPCPANRARSRQNK